MKKTQGICTIKLKRVYEPSEASDGERILVERLWPRGVSKERANINHWFKELAPSTELRKWYGHDLDKWKSFRTKYVEELRRNPSEELSQMKDLCKQKSVTFVYACHDEEHNSAVVLREFLN